MLFLIKSAAIDFVKPIIAAFVAPYANLFGRPLKLETIDDILIIFPLFCLIIFGSISLIIKYIDLTFTSKEKSQSFSSQSSIVP